MLFTVHGDHPDGVHSTFLRISPVGAVLKATDLIGSGWTGVHICDETNQTYWPDRFDQLYAASKPKA
jgi:hypothetical protein